MSSTFSGETEATDESEIYEVEELLDMRTQRGKTQYRVHWKGWDSSQDTWEPEENLLTCQDLITTFLAKRAKNAAEPAQPPGLGIEASDNEEEDVEPNALVLTTSGVKEEKKKFVIESEGDSEAANSGAESGSLARFREDLQSGRINVEEELPYSRVKQRRRGRKKKSLNELDLMRQAAVCQPSDTVGLSTAPIPPKKRGRGRPRKHPVVPKPIEQMPGTSTEPAVNYSFESDSQPVATPEKKRRGRKPLPKSPSNLTPPSSRKRAAESNTPVHSRKRKTLKGAETEPTPLEEHSVQELLTAIDQQIDQQENVETFMDTAEEASAQLLLEEKSTPVEETIETDVATLMAPVVDSEQLTTEMPGNPRLRRQAKALESLGLKLEPIDFNINEYRKQEMKFYQNEEGKKLTQHQFVDACKKIDATAVRRALLFFKRNPPSPLDLNVVDTEGNTLLMLMVKIPCDSAHELEDIMELLVQYGADTACPNKEGKTPLILAVEKGFLCKVTKLLSLGAAVNQPNPAGETPLYIACKLGFSHITYRLLEHGSNIGMKTAENKGLLDLPIFGSRQQNHCRDLLTTHMKKVKAVFMQELQFVLAGRVKLKTALFPMQCYALRESDTFMVNFNFNPNDYKHQLSPTGKFGFMLFLGLLKFTPAQITSRFWGSCPITKVELNGNELKTVQDEAKFLYELWPLAPGYNHLVITTCRSAIQSQMKMGIQGFFVNLKGVSSLS